MPLSHYAALIYAPLPLSRLRQLRRFACRRHTTLMLITMLFMMPPHIIDTLLP